MTPKEFYDQPHMLEAKAILEYGSPNRLIPLRDIRDLGFLLADRAKAETLNGYLEQVVTELQHLSNAAHKL